MNDELYFGRVEGLRNRDTCLACNPLTEIECTIGVLTNSFNGMEYILDRNWSDYGCRDLLDGNQQRIDEEWLQTG
ncbi:hypothetical protein V1520DRAFT_347133 [Lipomyces starkeyi]